jgi:hypothetical protein
VDTSVLQVSFDQEIQITDSTETYEEKVVFITTVAEGNSSIVFTR